MEDAVALRDRWLLVEGIASPLAIERVRSGLPEHWPQSARCVVVSYAYADLSLGKRFDRIFPDGQPGNAFPTTAIVKAVTQQFGRVFDGIPHGWKTICVIDFPDGASPLIDRLPLVEAWGISERRVGLGCRDAVEALKQTAAAHR